MRNNPYIEEQVYEKYKDFAIKAFDYFNGDVNRFIPCKLFVGYTDSQEKTRFGYIQYPNSVVIFLSECIDPYYIIYRPIDAYIDSEIKSLICMVIIHELMHAEQWIGPLEDTSKNYEKYFYESYEKSVEYRTSSWISNNCMKYSYDLGFDPKDIIFISPNDKRSIFYGSYEPISMKDFYFSMIAHLILPNTTCKSYISIKNMFDNLELFAISVEFISSFEKKFVPIRYAYHFNSSPQVIDAFNAGINSISKNISNRDFSIYVKYSNPPEFNKLPCGRIIIELCNYSISPIEIRENNRG